MAMTKPEIETVLNRVSTGIDLIELANEHKINVDQVSIAHGLLDMMETIIDEISDPEQVVKALGLLVRVQAALTDK